MNIKPHTIALALTIVLVGCSSGNWPKNEIRAVPISSSRHYFPTSTHLEVLANQAASRYGINHRLFHALIKHESAWDPYAISRTGARGLTQIMPNTGRAYCGLTGDVLFDPQLNLNCGASYFSRLLRRFKNVKLALAAYNSGETRVARLGRVPRIRETQRYVKRVMKSWQRGG
jgi:soluble lytic murein transglycosylase-like protein